MNSTFLSDFKKFAMKGNVVDMAVGVIIGGAFGKIVSSIVNDLLMPILGKVIGGINFSELKWVLTPAVKDAAGEVTTPEVAIGYGAFVQNTIDFLIIAMCIFVVIRVIGKLFPKEAEAPAAAPAPTKEELLLTEIRDLLKQQNSK